MCIAVIWRRESLKKRKYKKQKFIRVDTKELSVWNFETFLLSCPKIHGE